MSRRDDDELADLLRDLERDLDRLTDRLDADEEASARRPQSRSRERSRRRSTPGPRPPSPSDLVRFTEEYTIPTVISVLEATIQSLELLRGGLRLADPERRGRDDARGSSGVGGRVARELGGGASAALERTLSDLGTALSATELPEDADAREILEDARSLTDEIERRLAESNGPRDAGDGRADADRSEGIDRRRTDERGRTRRRRGDRRRRSSSRGVGIEVRDADEGRDGAARTDTSDSDDEDAAGDEDAADEGADGEAQVDVDAELESIRREVTGDSDGSDGSDDSGDGEEGSDESPDEDA